MSKVDPQGVALRSFGPPTEEEQEHHFLWRIRKELPAPGLIGVFDRSHYEDVLVARVDGLVPRTTWEGRFEEINRFESRPRRGGHDGAEVRDDGQPRRAGRAAHEAPGPSRQALEVQRQRPPHPTPVGRLPGGVRRRVPPDLHRRGAVVRRPGRPQVVRPAGHHRDPDPDADRPRPSVALGPLGPDGPATRARPDHEHQGPRRLPQRDRRAGREGHQGRPQGPQGGRPGQQGRRRLGPASRTPRPRPEPPRRPLPPPPRWPTAAHPPAEGRPARRARR